MRCQRCACDNPADGKFCQACGVPLAQDCPACGRGCPATAHFCGWCGASLRDGAPAIEPGGERKQATVLFADIVGSTALISGLDAEAAMGRLRPVVAAMAQAVRRFEGTILRTLGDGLKAAFGAPRAQEGHALLACQAALAMRDAVAAQPDAPRIRIGLHSGEVVAGALDTGSAVEQEAQGMTVHLASRIEQLAGPGEICLSRACRALVGAYCDTVSLGAHNLKGIPEPVEVYRLIGLKPAVASDQFRGSEPVRLRGRVTELGILQRALLDAEHGVASVIGISAAAGVGKSRLCFEFSEWCRRRHVEVLEARAHVFGHATPLLPVLEMLRTFFRITPLLEPEAARQRIAQLLHALDPDLAADLPLLADFLGVAAPESAAQRLDPRTRHARLRDVVRRMVRAAGRHPFVVIIEDLHWLDEASQDFVATMVEAADDANVMIVLNFRPSWTASWTARPNYRELRLSELEHGDIHHVVRDLVGDAPTLQRIIVHVAEQCGGNPFFAEELILSLAQEGVLLGERGQYRLAPSGWHDPVLPATVEAVIGARLDRLTEAEKSVLQIGAVIGKEFPLVLVRDVAGIAEPELRQLLDRLCGAELIQARATPLGASFAFRHPLIQEVAYAMQLRTRRTRLHAAVAKAIEGQAWGQLDEFASLLAHHSEAAGQPLEAALHLQRAALWVGRTNSSRALSDWKKMRWLLRDQPRSESIDRLRALASGRIVGFGWREGMAAEEAKPYAEEALRFAREAGDQKHEALLLGSYGRILAATGAVDEYIGLVREALELTDANGDPGEILTFYGMLSQAYSLAGLFNQALAANDAAIEAIAAQGQPQGVVLGLNVTQLLGFDVAHWIRCQRARILVCLGRLDEADAWLPRVLQVDPGRADPIVQFIPHAVAVELAWHRGDTTAAKWHAKEVADYAAQAAMPYLHVVALACNGLSAFTAGDFAAAEQHLREALAAARDGRAGLEYEAKLLAMLADAQDHAGNPVRAIQLADEAIEVARRRTDRLAECHASIVAARALLADNQLAGRQKVQALLGRAEELLGVTGAAILRPMLQRVQSRVDSVAR